MDKEAPKFKDEFFDYMSFKQVYPHTSSFLVKEGVSLEEAYGSVIRTFNNQFPIKRRKKVIDDLHFIKIFKFYRSRKSNQDLETSEYIPQRGSKKGSSMTFIDIPLSSPEIANDLSSVCEIISKM